MSLAVDHSVFIDVPPERVYETLTTASSWDAWFTKGMSLDLRIGGDIIFRWDHWGPDHVTAEDYGRILEFIPNRKFVFLWNLQEGGTTVTLSLEPRGGGTVLRITDVGYTSETYFMTCATGWGEALTLIKFYLESGQKYGDVP